MLDIVKDFENIFIICHVSPDGDCLGSAFGLKEIIKDNYKKEATVVSEYSESLSFIGEVTKPGTINYKDSLVISVDTGSSKRVCDQNFIEASHILRIDHHLYVDPFGHTNYVKDNYSSCCQLISDYAMDNNLIVSKEAASALLTGIITDTGRFMYRGVGESTFLSAAFLTSKGVVPTDIYDKLYQSSIESLKFKSYVYSNIKETEKGVLYLYITRDVINQYGLSDEEVSLNISTMSGIKDRPIYVLFYDKEDAIRARIRSSKQEINQVAAMFNGGGHALASGATVKDENEMKSLLNELDKLM